MDALSVASLVLKLGRVQRDLVRVQAEVVGWDGTQSSGTVKVALNSAKEFKKKYEDIQDAFDLKATAVDVATHEATFTTINTALINVMVGIEDVIDARHQAQQKNHTFKFDKLKLPTFSGEFSEWQEFADLFKAAIHTNGSIAGGAKMVYLKEALKGEAATIIANTPSTAAGYDEAWKKVESRYSNQREIVFSHLRKIYKLKIQSDSSIGLRKLCDTINELVRSLSQLSIEVDKWDVILVFLSLTKLEEETKKQWLLTQGNQLPILSEFLEYLEKRATALSDSTKSTSGRTQDSKSNSNQKSAHTTTTSGLGTNSSKWPCLLCNDDHPLFYCDKFKDMKVKEREAFVRKQDLCPNCFRRGHNTQKNPGDCNSRFSCKECGQRHNTLLHRQNQNQPRSSIPSTSSTSAESAPKEVTINQLYPTLPPKECSFGSTSVCNVLLETALVSVFNSNGEKKTVRVFVDKGSEAEFITETCASFLGLKRFGRSVRVTGLGGVDCGSTLGKVNLTLHSQTSDFKLRISAEIVPKVTSGNLPKCIGHSTFPHIRGLTLADPQFYRPQPVDILLGSRHASYIKRGGLILGPRGTPAAEETHFGWLLSGTIPQVSRHASSHTATINNAHIVTQVDCEEFPRSDLPSFNCKTLFKSFGNRRNRKLAMHRGQKRIPTANHSTPIPLNVSQMEDS